MFYLFTYKSKGIGFHKSTNETEERTTTAINILLKTRSFLLWSHLAHLSRNKITPNMLFLYDFLNVLK